MTKYKSVEMKMKTRLELSNPGFQEKSESDSTVIYGKKGDKWLSRNETKMTGTRKMGDQPEEKVDSRVLAIFDGDYVYTLTESAQGKQAMKAKQGSVNPFDRDMWKEQHKHFDIKLLADETVDGKSTWAIESRPKVDKDASPEEKAAMEGSRSVTNYRKSDGMAVKSVSYDKDGKPTMTMKLVDVKYDVDLKPEMFVFKAPEGVTVMDMEALQKQAGAGAGEGGDAEPSTGGDNTAAEGSPRPTEEKSAPREQSKPRSERKKGIGGLLNKLKK
jgi:outer membrane lipoprotein-sorting protein